MGVPSPHRLPPAAPFHPIPGLSGPPGHCCLLWRGAERRHTRAGQHAPRRHGLSLCPPTYPFGFCYCLPAPAGGYGCGRWLLLPAHPLLPAYLCLLLPACRRTWVWTLAATLARSWALPRRRRTRCRLRRQRPGPGRALVRRRYSARRSSVPTCGVSGGVRGGH